MVAQKNRDLVPRKLTTLDILAVQARDGDRAAAEALFAPDGELITYMRDFTRSRFGLYSDSLQEVIADATARMWERLSHFDPDKGGIITWAIWQAIWASQKRIRARVRQKVEVGVSDEFLLNLPCSRRRGACAVQSSINNETKEIIVAASKKCLLGQSLLVFRLVTEGRNFTEIAKETGVTKERIRQIFNRAILRLSANSVQFSALESNYKKRYKATSRRLLGDKRRPS